MGVSLLQVLSPLGSLVFFNDERRCRKGADIDGVTTGSGGRLRGSYYNSRGDRVRERTTRGTGPGETVGSSRSGELGER